jgi:RNA polymerase sigma-70 factor (ECF subfamily)
MNGEPLATEQLSQISTFWTALVRREPGANDPDRAQATAFVERYQAAVYGYLVRCVHDADRATELFQEFALRFLRGDFHRADPSRGRFRDYLRTVLIHLVRGSYRGHAPGSLPHDLVASPEATDDPDDTAFLAQWRETILNLVWAGLAAEEAGGGPPYHTLLQARAARPNETSADLAESLSRQFTDREAFSETNVRKLLQRGREHFADRVVAEVGRSIPSTEPDRIAQELIDLGFHSFCKKALERWAAENQ